MKNKGQNFEIKWKLRVGKEGGEGETIEDNVFPVGFFYVHVCSLKTSYFRLVLVITV